MDSETTISEKIEYIFSDIVLLALFGFIAFYILNLEELNIGLTICGWIVVVFAGFDLLTSIISLIISTLSGDSGFGDWFFTLLSVALFVASLVVALNVYPKASSTLMSIFWICAFYVAGTLILGPITNLSFQTLFNNIIDVVQIASFILYVQMGDQIVWLPIAYLAVEFIVIVIETIVSFKDGYTGSDIFELILNIIIYLSLLIGCLCYDNSIANINSFAFGFMIFSFVDFGLGAIVGTVCNVKDLIEGDGE